MGGRSAAQRRVIEGDQRPVRRVDEVDEDGVALLRLGQALPLQDEVYGVSRPRGQWLLPRGAAEGQAIQRRGRSQAHPLPEIGQQIVSCRRIGLRHDAKRAQRERQLGQAIGRQIVDLHGDVVDAGRHVVRQGEVKALDDHFSRLP